MPGDHAQQLLSVALHTLATRRPVFHSEADLQHELAWELREATDAVRLEVPYPPLPVDAGTRRRRAIDLLLTVGGQRVGVELKYPKGTADLVVGGEAFRMSTGTSDSDRYGPILDVERLEQALAARFIDIGVVVVLTNRADLWSPPSRAAPTNFDAFRLHHGRVLSGVVAWGPNTGAGSKGGMPEQALLTGTYDLAWRDYAVVPAPRAGVFRYLLMPVVTPAEIDPHDLPD